MKNKKKYIFFIIILSILTLLLITFTAYLLIKTPKITFNFDKKDISKIIYEESYNIENIDNIKINTISSDIKFKSSTDNKLKIIVYGNENNEFKISLENNILDINYDIKNNFCIGICYQEDFIVVHIPDTYNNKINISTTSGDITEINLTNANLDIKTTSGDTKINNINKLDIISTSGDINIENVNTINAKTTSGDININNITNKLNIEANSGDIEINSLSLKANSNIKSTSGDVEIEKTNSIYIEAKTTSGEIKINNNNRKADYELIIKTTSGDIEVNNY